MEMKIKEYSARFCWHSPSGFHKNKKQSENFYKDVNMCFLCLHVKEKGNVFGLSGGSPSFNPSVKRALLCC